MKAPNIIYLGQNPITGDPDDDWRKTRCESSDVVYFSEERIRETLKQVVDDANRLIDMSTTVHKIKIDANKYIPHVIELLLKGDEQCQKLSSEPSASTLVNG